MSENGPSPEETGIDPEEMKTPEQREGEKKLERMERFRKRVIDELLEDGIESVAADLESQATKPSETFEIEFELDTLEAGDKEIPLSLEELNELESVLLSDEARQIYKENGVTYLSSEYSSDSFTEGRLVFKVKLVKDHESKEMSAEFVEQTFSNTCFYCKEAGEADPTVVLTEKVPTSMAGKWKKGKGKDKGKEYRDWDYGEVSCPKCEERGKPSKVFLFYREYK